MTPATGRGPTPAPTSRWWVPLVVLGLVTAAIAYVTGIAASRRLGSRLASFVALVEVVAGVVLGLVAARRAARAPSSCSAAC